jgi:hypothetical protein
MEICISILKRERSQPTDKRFGINEQAACEENFPAPEKYAHQKRGGLHMRIDG